MIIQCELMHLICVRSVQKCCPNDNSWPLALVDRFSLNSHRKYTFKNKFNQLIYDLMKLRQCFDLRLMNEFCLISNIHSISALHADNLRITNRFFLFVGGRVSVFIHSFHSYFYNTEMNICFVYLELRGGPAMKHPQRYSTTSGIEKI